MPSIAIAPKQRVHTTPFFQRYYSVPIVKLEDEIENAITQVVTNGDKTRVPSADAVYDFVMNFSGAFDNLTFSFPIPSSEWVVVHNKNTNSFVEIIYDSNLNRMLAPIEIIDQNSFKVILSEPMTGFVIVQF